MYVLGYDIGSSSIKAALVEAQSGRVAGSTQYPASEMEIRAPRPGFAEQDPDIWWQNLCRATRQLLDQTGVKPDDIAGIGIAYQMHGLVLADKAGNVLRPAIIWCDSRAVEIGQKAFRDLGKDFCLTHYLNSPGNFTASKLRWVREKEPDIFAQIHKIMLPGDFIVFKLTGEIQTTLSGLSEGIFWDFKQNDLARDLLAHYEIPEHLLPDRVKTFGIQGTLTRHAAAETGLRPGIPVAYRAGDQPNNALSLGVLDPGQVAATGGTSGVVYGVADRPMTDPQSRINVFAHVNHRPEAPRLGLLLCINGAGIQYAWLKNQMAPAGSSYADMEQMAQSVAPGADGLRVLPFGNGAERMLGGQNPGARFLNVQFNRHKRAHFYRAPSKALLFHLCTDSGFWRQQA